jgi:hypothetical protein
MQRPGRWSVRALLIRGMNLELDELELRSNSSCYSAPPGVAFSKQEYCNNHGAEEGNHVALYAKDKLISYFYRNRGIC